MADAPVFAYFSNAVEEEKTALLKFCLTISGEIFEVDTDEDTSAFFEKCGMVCSRAKPSAFRFLSSSSALYIAAAFLGAGTR